MDQCDPTAIQTAQYAFPYHHIPHLDAAGCGAVLRQLTWGLEYLCYQLHIRELALGLKPQSVLEVGCGEGFFIGHLGSCVPARVGVDIVESAIHFGRGFHPDVAFHVGDAADLSGRFDLVAAVEVLEHIPDSGVSAFLNTLAERTKQDGHVLIVVPSVILPLNPKHHRHYDLETLERQIAESGAPLAVQSVEYIYREPLPVKLYRHLADNRVWTLDMPWLRRRMWKRIWNKYRVCDKKQGRHLVAVLDKKA